MTTWLLSTIGKRGYIARYLREASNAAGVPVRIIGTGSDTFTPGFAACDEWVTVPPYDTPEYGPAVVEIVERLGVDAVLTFSDPDVAALAAIRDDLVARGVRCYFPDATAVLSGFDKLRTAEIATRAGVSVPATAVPSARHDLPFPRIWKPRTGSASRGLWRVDDPAAETELDLDRFSDTEYIVQERLTGAEFDVELLIDLDGRVVRSSSWRKMRSSLGETELALTESFAEATAQATAFAAEAGLVGPLDFDWFETERGPYLIEVNTRFGGGYPVSHLAGAGFVEALVRLAQGERVDPAVLVRTGVYMMKELVPFAVTADEWHRSAAGAAGQEGA